MKKLLHERLRDTEVFDDVKLDKTWLCISEAVANELSAEIERDYIPREQYVKEMESKATDHMKVWAEAHDIPFVENEIIVEWLDRWFILRPRFEGGEPVQWDSEDVEWEDDNINEWHISAIRSDGVPIADDGDEICAVAKMRNGFVVRKESDVLDADGVPINVGDTVYRVEGDWYGHVKGFDFKEHEETIVLCDSMKSPANYLTHKEPVLDADGVPIKVGDTVWLLNHSTKYTVDKIDDPRGLDRVMIKDEDDFCEWHMPHRITHKEPDSLEKLRDDMASYKSTETFYRGRQEDDFGSFLDRLTALIERGK